jgi:type I restriction enzyme M protein
MSEELLQVKSEAIGRYELYKLGATNLGQLKKANIINSRYSKEYAAKKPDGIIVLPGGDVKAVIEYKQPLELVGARKIDKATKQMMAMTKEVCKLLIVTSGKKTFWVNALNGKPILDEKGYELKRVFDIKPIIEGKLTNEELSEWETLIDKIDHSLTDTNNQIAQPTVIDPSSLARTVWQKIWINTGKEPEKCLYNVVELFVFKFLSDVGVLKSHKNFQAVYNLHNTDSAVEALKHYANVCRPEIRSLFPSGQDGTTIINGTIFVNEKGQPNVSQAYLFGEVLQNLQEFDRDIGSFKYIRKEFKTRLYESFLRQQAGIRSLGQYFTPRNVVQAMVGMSNAKTLKKGARIGDPFCGVGGFILETIAENPHIFREFEPRNGKVNPQITLLGYDKGTDEKEDERTIILAKANMLIYFSDLLVKYNSPAHLKAFSEGAFNKVFHLIRSNLGSFERVNDEPFDLILTNPPYVTSGSSSLKKLIDNSGLSQYYSSGGRGTESLALEWIIRNLKEGGQALVVVPDGLMNQSSILSYIRETCFLQCIVSLPTRTFYSTPKKTYILSLIRKGYGEAEQTDPVFTYLVGEIGETRDAKRFYTDENHLSDLVSLFNMFRGSPTIFRSTSDRCKIISFAEIKEKSNWMIDRWWSKDEKKALGIEAATEEMNEREFIGLLTETKVLINNFLKELKQHGA